jgi:putative Mn2+ efflux pump MntP
MTANAPAVLVAAASVGFAHAVLPDHWVPLALLGRTRRYPLTRVARLSALAGFAHVLVSLVLGGVVVAVGLELRSDVESVQDSIVGAVLILTGLGLVVLDLSGRGHGHEHSHSHSHGGGHTHGSHEREPRGRIGRLAAVVVPFGAAASPDLTILPVFLAATTYGVATAIGSLIVFAVVTIATFVVLTLAAARGGYRIRAQWLERRANLLTGLVLVIIGALVLAGVV